MPSSICFEQQRTLDPSTIFRRYCVAAQLTCWLLFDVDIQIVFLNFLVQAAFADAEYFRGMSLDIVGHLQCPLDHGFFDHGQSVVKP